MRALLVAVLAVSASACSADTQYKNAAEFEAAVESWRLVGKSESDAMAFLRKQGFLCKEHYCYKQTKGLVCNQKLKIDFVLNKEKTIVQATILKLPNGHLPDACL
ncbi:hypothetical protein EZJ19_07135 [Parasulfuritortus cantonensis]|uniref:Lipoprotein n=1 Tax=Parasulfuritortus cantonensis TaxID=2528202 RepID=A0A4V2NVZ4_9PROT|nr:hypothetical protein [Parasulfuritortus cantonensis]TCJ15382.1 hypothetical protein EZJ19_07135 [Parasulfuritortus cantonensis]